jgi:ankyrin repeat protein
MSKQLPDRPNLDHLRKQAKELIASYRSGDPEAIERFKQLPGKTGKPALHDAQSVVAREYGFSSWRELVGHIEEVNSKRGITPEVVEKFIRLAAGEGQGSLERMLQLFPGLPKHNIQTGLAFGDVEMVREWLRSHSVDEKLEPLRWTALEYVCYSRISRLLKDRYEPLLECARLLLDAGAEPNTAHNYEGNENAPLPVLYGATCHAQHEGIARLLLEKGAKPNDGESIYHSAQMNLRPMLQLLFDHGADISGTDANYGNTPLYFNAGHRVSDSNYERAMLGCEWLLDHGADPNLPSGECKETPVFPAVKNGNLRLAKALLDHRTDPNISNADGLTAYMFAAVTGAGDLLELLAERGANTTLPGHGQFLADCAEGQTDRVQAALLADPDLILKLSDKERSAICKMAEMGRTLGVKTCLEAGIPIDTLGEGNATALHFACYCQWDETAWLLIKAGAPLEVRDGTYNATPLGWVLEGFLWNRNAKGDGIRIVKELLAAGADDENLKQRLQTDDAENPAMIELMQALGR